MTTEKGETAITFIQRSGDVLNEGGRNYERLEW